MNINDIYIANVIDMSMNGDGIVKVENNYTFFVRGAVVGDEIEFIVTKMNKTYGFGKLLRIINYSKSRRENLCSKSDRCGGCTLLNLKYETQLEIKSNTVRSNMSRIGGFSDQDYTYEGIIGAECELFYRNKAQFPVGIAGDVPVCGFYLPKSHNIVMVDSCKIQSEKINFILKSVMKYIKSEKISVYNEKSHNGVIRHIYIRDGGDDAMICIVTNTSKKLKNLKRLVDELLNMGNISIIQNVNTEKTNVVLGKKNITLFGNSYIHMNVGKFRFRVSPNSFFQVNTNQMEKLYQKVLEYASVSKNDIVFDLYCGVGSISLFLAEKAKHVIGVEIIEDAIENAKENARINCVDNVSFYCGDCGKTVDFLLNNGKTADIVVVDPPRKGCDDKTIELLKKINPRKIVYVSCNSSTFARDASKLHDFGYKIDKICAVDMFPQTMHVETVCLMSRKDS